MENLDDRFNELIALAASPARRVKPKVAAKYLGLSIRTLEDWRAAWRRAEEEGNPALRIGPPFFRFKNRRVLYEVGELARFRELRSRPTNAQAKLRETQEPTVEDTLDSKSND